MTKSRSTLLNTLTTNSNQRTIDENYDGTDLQVLRPSSSTPMRIPVGGLIAQYSAIAPRPGPDMFLVLRVFCRGRLFNETPTTDFVACGQSREVDSERVDFGS